MKYVIVSALEEEFPFKNEFNVLYTGVGKINSCISLMKYLSENNEIKNVINVGTAASVNNNVGEVVECGNFINGDLDYPGYISDDILFKKNKYTLGTFDSFQINIPKRNCDYVDMEGYSFAKICKINKLNFLCFKYITDKIGESNQEKSWINELKKGKFLLKETIINYL